MIRIAFMASTFPDMSSSCNIWRRECAPRYRACGSERPARAAEALAHGQGECGHVDHAQPAGTVLHQLDQLRQRRDVGAALCP